MLKDIETRHELSVIMKQFYEKLLADSSIAYIFTDVAKIDLEVHLPHLVDFWSLLLLGEAGYKKNVTQVHLDLHQKSPLQKTHFNTWLQHFNASVDELHSGPKADEMKSRAHSIAVMMMAKMQLLV